MRLLIWIWYNALLEGYWIGVSGLLSIGATMWQSRWTETIVCDIIFFNFYSLNLSNSFLSYIKYIVFINLSTNHYIASNWKFCTKKSQTLKLKSSRKIPWTTMMTLKRRNIITSLAKSIHNLLEISLSLSVLPSLQIIPTKYNIIVRLWTYAFH